jgi:hypothetical protein
VRGDTSRFAFVVSPEDAAIEVKGFGNLTQSLGNRLVDGFGLDGN